MLYRSFLSSQHDLIHAPEENGEERSLDNKFAMFVTLLQEAFHKFLDGEETDPEFTNDPVSEAYQIVSKALPNELKKLAPTVDLMRYLLEEISSICFTESAGLMHIVSLHKNFIFTKAYSSAHPVSRRKSWRGKSGVNCLSKHSFPNIQRLTKSLWIIFLLPKQNTTLRTLTTLHKTLLLLQLLLQFLNNIFFVIVLNH